MKKKQTLAMLLAAAMVLSMPVGAYAEELDEVENSAGLVEPYIADKEAPVLHDIQIDKTSVNAGENITITIDATDDLSNIKNFSVVFYNKENGREYRRGSSKENPLSLTINISDFEEEGTFELTTLWLDDNLGNYSEYFLNPIGDEQKLPKEISFTVNKNENLDNEVPTLKTISLDKKSVAAGDSVTVSLDAEDVGSGIKNFTVVFTNLKNGREYRKTSDNPNSLTFTVSEYEAEGVFQLTTLWIDDNAGNYADYGSTDQEIQSISFSVKKNPNADLKAPVFQSVSIDRTEIKAGESVAVSLEAEDSGSGIARFSLWFRNKENGREIYAQSTQDNPYRLILETSEFEPSGRFELSTLWIDDNAGNYEDYIDQISVKPFFIVINDDPVTPPPTDPETPSNPSNPTTPSRPNSSTTTVPGTPINYESEKPDPADEQAVEAYNFWQNTKREIRVYERAGSLRVYVPTDVTYMPASVMETLRVENVPVVLQWQGHRIEIPGGKAQPKQPLKAYWPMKTLCELYNA